MLAPLHFMGVRLGLDPFGALVWPDLHLVVVADLHLEKGSAAARRGSLVPPWDSRLTLDRLAVLVRRLKPRILVALGDSFHDTGGPGRLAAADAARLAAITAQTQLIWVQGNHDPCPPDGVGGTAVAEYAAGPLVFRHAAVAGAGGEISGHFHPKASIPTRAGEVTRPCFVTGAQKIILPAFGAYTGGLSVQDPAIAGLFPKGGRVFLLGENRLFSFAMAPGRRGGAGPRLARGGAVAKSEA